MVEQFPLFEAGTELCRGARVFAKLVLGNILEAVEIMRPDAEGTGAK